MPRPSSYSNVNLTLSARPSKRIQDPKLCIPTKSSCVWTAETPSTSPQANRNSSLKKVSPTNRRDVRRVEQQKKQIDHRSRTEVRSTTSSHSIVTDKHVGCSMLSVAPVEKRHRCHSNHKRADQSTAESVSPPDHHVRNIPVSSKREIKERDAIVFFDDSVTSLFLKSFVI